MCSVIVPHCLQAFVLGMRVKVMTPLTDELMDSPTMHSYTTVQRLAEGVYVLLTFVCPAAIIALSWPRCRRILQYVSEKHTE